MTGVILDASAALAWCFENEHTPESDLLLERVQSDGALVPPIWDLEVGNALLVAERRGRLTSAAVARYVALLESLPIEPAEDEPAVGELVALARRHGLSTYDASYLFCALRSGWPLATHDAALRAAAITEGGALA